MKRQTRYNEQHAKVLQHEEVDLGGHEVHFSAEVGHPAHQIDQHEEGK